MKYLKETKTGLLIGAHHMRLQHPYHDADALRLQSALLGHKPQTDWDGIIIAAFVLVVVMAAIVYAIGGAA